MKTVMVLYPSDQQNDAEHTMEVLEEEFALHRIPCHHIGKEIIQTKTTRFVFRDIHQPSVHNRIKHIDKLYVMKNILKDEEVEAYEGAIERDWLNMPSGGLYEYLMDVKHEIPTDKVTRYEIEQGEVKKVQVEIYKAHRVSYYESEEEALIVWEAWKKKEEEKQNRLERAEKPKRKRKKDSGTPIQNDILVTVEKGKAESEGETFKHEQLALSGL